MVETSQIECKDRIFGDIQGDQRLKEPYDVDNTISKKEAHGSNIMLQTEVHVHNSYIFYTLKQTNAHGSYLE